MPVAEITFVGDRIEVYARVQTETGEVLDVYWSRKDTFPADFDKPHEDELPNHDGSNPLFVHADNPNEAFFLAAENYHTSPDDEAQVKATLQLPKLRLEYLRNELRAERISYGELAELQDLAAHIAPGDVELLEPAGVPEFPHA